MSEQIKVKVFGPGCPKCKRTEEIVSTFLNEKGIRYQLEKVSNFDAIINAGIISTPALMINDKLILQGRIVRQPDLEIWLKNYSSKDK